jgi:hypothetical protein
MSKHLCLQAIKIRVRVIFYPEHGDSRRHIPKDKYLQCKIPFLPLDNDLHDHLKSHVILSSEFKINCVKTKLKISPCLGF